MTRKKKKHSAPIQATPSQLTLSTTPKHDTVGSNVEGRYKTVTYDVKRGFVVTSPNAIP